MNKDIILFVNAIRPATFGALEIYEQKTGRTFTPIVLVDQKIQESITKRNGQKHEGKDLIVLNADFDSPSSLMKAIRPYRDRIYAVTCQYENSMLELKKLVPYFPYLPMPSERSLDWSTEKKLMRELLEAYDPSLVPGYMEVMDNSDATIAEIEAKLTYPVVIKPSGLEGSLLVSMANNRTELTDILGETFREVQKAYDVWIKRQKPRLLVEEFMDGDMYSVDTYVAADGTCRPAPPVKVLTGRRVGFDDFFGYMRATPSGLSEQEIGNASATAEKACHALGLRSVTAHVELMKLPHGWKVIELGSRIGGYRHDIYALSYGINHIMNDILNRAGDVPEIFTEVLSSTAVFNIYAHEEGMLERIEGIEEVKQLASFVSLKQSLREGDSVLFAKHNGDPVFEIILSNKDKDQFDADVRHMQECLILEVTHTKPLVSVN
ncbi:MAG: hypothetical protein JWN26_448 [Candidatus Saccharibacteria bacterium]|nr:hypothetical protein [Candidatus Saccharibacteria bacterium]